MTVATKRIVHIAGLMAELVNFEEMAPGRVLGYSGAVRMRIADLYLDAKRVADIYHAALRKVIQRHGGQDQPDGAIKVLPEIDGAPNPKFGECVKEVAEMDAVEREFALQPFAPLDFEAAAIPTSLVIRLKEAGVIVDPVKKEK